MKYDAFYLHSKAETNINEKEADDVFKSICTTYTTVIKILQNIQEKFLAGLLIQSQIIILTFQNTIP